VASNAESPASVTAPAEQPNEYGEKQDDVCDDQEDDVKFAALGVEYYTLSMSEIPVGAELQMNKPKKSKVLKTVFTRAIPDIISFLTFCRKGEMTYFGWRLQRW
jgi:hypothetical protein